MLFTCDLIRSYVAPDLGPRVRVRHADARLAGLSLADLVLIAHVCLESRYDHPAPP